jgi:hypothetical protein
MKIVWVGQDNKPFCNERPQLKVRRRWSRSHTPTSSLAVRMYLNKNSIQV